MKTTGSLLISLASLASVAYAQNGVPTCGQPCITPYVSGSQIAGCGQEDISCICANSAFLSGISCCLEASCDAADQQQAVSFALNLCSANGVTNLPTAASVLCTSSVTYTGSAGTATTTASVTTTSGSTSASTGASVASTGSASHTASVSSTSSSSAAAATKTSGARQHAAGMGAGIVGGLAGLAMFL